MQIHMKGQENYKKRMKIQNQCQLIENHYYPLTWLQAYDNKKEKEDKLKMWNYHSKSFVKKKKTYLHDSSDCDREDSLSKHKTEPDVEMNA